MLIKKIQNNKGFVLLFAVTIASILLAIALGVANISYNEVRFGTSARGTNDAFFAADAGIENALFLDKAGTYAPTGPVVISGLGGGGQGCVIVTVNKTNPALTIITAKGYDTGGGTAGACNPSVTSIERHLQTTYSVSISTPPPPPEEPPSGDDGWACCATESGTCSFPGAKWARYGDNGTYNYVQATNSIICYNPYFPPYDDPTPGYLKHCDYYGYEVSASTCDVTPPPTCEPEDDQCICEADGKYWYGDECHDDPEGCNGDPECECNSTPDMEWYDGQCVTKENACNYGGGCWDFNSCHDCCDGTSPDQCVE